MAQGVAIHSIAFFTDGGVMATAASISNGSFLRINGPSDLVHEQVDEADEPQVCTSLGRMATHLGPTASRPV